MKENAKKIAIIVLKMVAALCTAALGVLGATTLTSCGVTRATIANPRDGSQTTITITTNNPITTNVDPNTNATFEYKPSKN